MSTRFAALALSAAAITGCASIVSGTTQSVSVDARSTSGEPVIGANCKLQNGDGTWFVTTPGSTMVDRAFSDLTVQCEMKGRPSASTSAKSSTKVIAFGNIFIGGIVGAGVDIANGAAYEYPSPITVHFSDVVGASDPFSADKASTQHAAASSTNHQDAAADMLASATALEQNGCSPAKAPIKFRQTDRGAYYETHCTDGRLFHSICKDGACRLRTSAD